METSQVFESNGRAVPSPSGQYIASQTPQHLYIQYAHSLETAFTFPLHASTSTSARAPDASSIQWSHTSTHILLISTSAVSVYSLETTERKARITNGSAGLGRILAAEMVGLERGSEQVVVVWEFGRIAVWDLQTGRAAEEIGEVKLGSGTVRSAWGIRREKGKAEVLALLSRHQAQDTLTLFLPPSTTPFKTITLPTTDAQSLTWNGSWLSVLDSPLASPAASLFILTPDGHLFRTHPSPTSPLPTEPSDPSASDIPALGPKSLAWSIDHLALADSLTSTITLLSTRTFTPVLTLSLPLQPADFCHQEIVFRSSQRTWKIRAASMIPLPSSHPTITSSETWDFGAVSEMFWNAAGTRLAVRFEGYASAIFVWKIPALAKERKGAGPGDKGAQVERPVMVVYSGVVRKIVWHGVRESLLLIQSEDGGSDSTGDAGIYLFDAAGEGAPIVVEHSFAKTLGSGSESAKVDATFVSEEGAGEEERLRVLVSTRRLGWVIVYPEGREQDYVEERVSRMARAKAGSAASTTGDEAVSNLDSDQIVNEEEDGEEEGDMTHDSLYDILTGRTPLPELGSGRMVDRDVDVVDDGDDEMGGLQDTFREKNRRKEEVTAEGEEQAGTWDDEMF